MTERLRRRRQGDATYPEPDAPTARLFPNSPSEPATDDDRKNWKGFCEIESEPAFFNVMLNELGVQGVKAREVLGLDPELLALLPQPVYGLVFLSQWREEESNEQENDYQERVWFANQTFENACASVALLNIVNNLPSVVLGETLEQFKQSTLKLTPLNRGDCIGQSEFIKKVHNSFARKMDMLDSDLFLKGKATKKAFKSRKKTESIHNDNTAFHFIAFVHVEGHVWKLDGLEKQPRTLGMSSAAEWLDLVKPFLESCILKYQEGQIQFSLVALVKDPIIELRRCLAENVHSIQEISARLDEVQPDWKDFVVQLVDDGASEEDRLILCANSQYGLRQDAIDKASVVSSIQESLVANCSTTLMTVQQRLICQQDALRASIRAENTSMKADTERAAGRRHDYGFLVQSWLKLLIQKGTLRTLIQNAGEEV